MDKFRIMIIDDSVLMRMLLNKVIGTDAELEVIASVDNAERGISLIPKLNPDIITLDIEMPGMNGLNAVTEIRAKKYQVPIIMCSSLSLRGAEATIDALQRGANDFVTKPSSTSNTTYTFDEMAVELLYKIHALVKSQKKPSVISRQQSVLLCAPKDRIDVICIGISTGGPDALLTLLPKIPENFPIPIIIVQHMSALFTRVLAASLDKKCSILVKEAEDGEELMPGCAYIAPGNYHVQIIKKNHSRVLQLNQDPQENSCRPSVDVLLRSVADVYKTHALVVIMTGMGQDGLLGCQRVKAEGGFVVIQDEASSVVWGMPGAIAKNNLEDKMLPLKAISEDLVNLVMQTRTKT